MSVSADFVRDLKTGRAAAQQVDDGRGNMVLEGRVLVDGHSSPALPGEFFSILTVSAADAAVEDAIPVMESYWLWADGEAATASSVTRTVRVKTAS